MQIKPYSGKDMQEVLRKVKEEMGQEAIILSTRKVKGGIEVVAAIDRPPAGASETPIPPRFYQLSPSEGAVLSGRSEEERFLQKLTSAGLYPKFVQELAEAIHDLHQRPLAVPLPEAYRGLLNWRLMEQVEVMVPSPSRPRVWAFVGPTGIGKTTTMVKLAAHYRLKETDRVTLITTDTYRIGAVEQLKQYAQLLRLPLEVAYRPDDLRRIIEQHQDRDLLLIDTAGRSPKSPEAMEELKDFMTAHPKIENHLLLSATMKETDLAWIVDRFRVIPIASYIFTKLDETTHYIPLFNQLMRYKRPLSYLTHGQNVPEDIEQATKSRVAHMVLDTLLFH
ncbi:MAG: hypothetical protein N3G78_06260 [Desulfobacterota bacterium]|nr:hypothetical protein [Thermodesulfobacteriota bacterium]